MECKKIKHYDRRRKERFNKIINTMELISGNNEKDFNKFCVNKYGWSLFNKKHLALKNGDSFLIYFDELDFEMQKGVFKEYYKYLGYHFHTELGVNLRTSLIDGYNYFINQVKDNKKEFVYLGFSETEEEANKEILSKLDEIVNNN